MDGGGEIKLDGVLNNRPTQLKLVLNIYISIPNFRLVFA